ncbi:MAG: BTAD domain-containing putative transcriptional regulator [Caldilineaceae bacterium]
MTKVITLLGGFQVYNDGCALTGFQSDKARALLAYLAVEADRPHRRAQLAGLFWPEWPEPTALTYLRHALANVRKVLGTDDTQEPPLLVTRQTIQFNPTSGYQVDVLQLTDALHALTAPAPALAPLQAAVATYQHAFLEGFYLNGCAAFEEWVVATRERLQRQIIEALHHLATHYEAQGNYSQAHHYAQRRVDLAPWLEEAHRQIMRLHALNGQRSAALVHYERCRNQLSTELGIEPSTETQGLYTAIRTGQFDKVTGRSASSVEPWQGDKVTSTSARAGQATSAHVDAAVTLSSPHPVTPPPHHNLPAPTTPLLGRTNELVALQGLLQHEAVRLVTLTGPGGVGKTRLGLATAGQLLAAFADGVFVTFLAPLREPALVLSALAQTLNVSETGSRPLFARLVTLLRERCLLLVLDNFEHLLAAAPVIADLLAACPRLKVLATSRERLRLQGEHEYVTAPLPVPIATHLLTSVQLSEWPAVALFCQRAAAARHDFVPTPENLTAIAAICTRLDGLPLAIELAAARSKLLTPPALLKRLTYSNGDLPLQFLKNDTRNAEIRHRSLWDTIAWSYALLEADEQRFFRRLAVFVRWLYSRSGCRGL